MPNGFGNEEMKTAAFPLLVDMMVILCLFVIVILRRTEGLGQIIQWVAVEWR